MNGAAVKSCTMFAVQADGAEILTVEGLAKNGDLHPLQKAFGDSYGLQCGYCTPGIMLSAYQLLSTNTKPSEKEMRKAIAGNTCRCTGYQNIFKAIQLRRPEHEGGVTVAIKLSGQFDVNENAGGGLRLPHRSQ